ncbi:hypothetical protein LCGC14_1891510 [marine sediment metagenome]|uniref:Uncharacterized protein n=1 Tax=marine sediment metagenome TaxID=412755 RepID=A0A0F9ID93_9ZZZZ
MRRFLPRMVAPLALAASVLFPASMLSALEIEGPTTPIEPGEYVQLFVRGLDSADVPNARVVHWPRQRVQVVPAQTWGGGPFIWFGARLPGEYFLAVISGDDYAEAIIQVGEGKPDPDPKPDPKPNPDPQPLPPLADLVVTIVEERDDAATMGFEGAQLANHLTEVNVYLATIGVRREVIDDDQPGAAQYVAFLDAAGIKSRPAWIVRSPKTKKVYAVRAFGKLGSETIQNLKSAGIK